MFQRLLPLLLFLAGESAERCIGRVLVDTAGLYLARRRCASAGRRLSRPCPEVDWADG